MLICSAALSSTISRRLRRGLAYSLIWDSAALTPSVVVGLLTKENAPRASACWRSSSSVMIWTGMCRVSGLCFNWLSTVQPSMSGRKTSSDTAVGWNCLASSSASAPRRGDQHLETLVAGEVDQHARVMRIVLDDQQDRIARFEIQPVVRQLFDRPFLRGDRQGAGAPVAATRPARAAPRSVRNISAADRG